MKYLMTLIALVAGVTAGAQGTTIYEYPWNPDWDNDNFVGTSDLTGFLSAFGSEFGNPPEPCDYDGTPLEELLAGITDGTIILDSVFIEYELVDTSSYYQFPCPEPITDTVLFGNTALLTQFEPFNPWKIRGLDSYGANIEFYWNENGIAGEYRFSMVSQSLTLLGFTSDGLFGNGSLEGWFANTEWVPAPLPSTWFLDEDGIHIESGWTGADWPYYANYLHILPYWHYAE
jgi:hypothetical protein